MPGLAKTGPMICFLSGYKISHVFDILLMAGFSENVQDEDAYYDFLLKQFGPDYTFFVNTNRWGIFKGMTGIGYNVDFPGKSNLSLKTRLFVGACKTAEPGFISGGSSKDIFGPHFYADIGKKSLPVSFAFQVNAELVWHSDKSIYLFYNINYFYSRTGFDYVYPNGFPVAFPPEGRREYNLSSLNTGLGVGFDL